MSTCCEPRPFRFWLGAAGGGSLSAAGKRMRDNSLDEGCEAVGVVFEATEVYFPVGREQKCEI